jgi:hypothetical protein
MAPEYAPTEGIKGVWAEKRLEKSLPVLAGDLAPYSLLHFGFLRRKFGVIFYEEERPYLVGGGQFFLVGPTGQPIGSSEPLKEITVTPTTSFGQPGELLGVDRDKAKYQLGCHIDILLGRSVSVTLDVVNQEGGLDNFFAPNLWVMLEGEILPWKFSVPRAGILNLGGLAMGMLSIHSEKVLEAKEAALIPVRPIDKDQRGGVLVVAVKDLRKKGKVAQINTFLEHP